MSKRHQMSTGEWERRLHEVPVSKDDLNRLIMDYLVIEGYKNAAERFAAESGLSPRVDLESIENRMTIRSAIQRGDIEDAIGRVNELDPEILDTNPLLYFHLQQQMLIELIRAGDLSRALSFAAENLAPSGEEHPDLLPELERTMALLAFDISKVGAPGSGGGGGGGGKGSAALQPPPHVAELLAPAQRLRTAGELNAAILASQSQGRDPKLPQLLRLLVYGEGLLGPRGPGKLEFPSLDLDSHVATTPQSATAGLPISDVTAASARTKTSSRPMAEDAVMR